MTDANQYARDHGVDALRRFMDEVPAEPVRMNGHAQDAPRAVDVTSFALIQSSAQFIGGFVPPDYLVDGILQRRFVYSLTGKTGSGKTAFLALFGGECCAPPSTWRVHDRPG